MLALKKRPVESETLRELSDAEVDAVSGGDDEIIIVIGKLPDDGGGGVTGRVVYTSFGGVSGGGEGGGGSGTSGYTPDPSASDEEEIDVDVNLENPTDDQIELLEEFAEKIKQLTAVIEGLSDTAQIQLSDGSVVTGAELKSLWAKVDFTINPSGTVYANGTSLGQADFNGGNPQVSFNIDTLEGYDLLNGGLEYAILHEIGHMARGGGAYYSEVLANDIARALAHYAGINILSNPGFGYSSGGPLIFGPPSGSGGGGGAGGGENLPPSMNSD